MKKLLTDSASTLKFEILDSLKKFERSTGIYDIEIIISPNDASRAFNRSGEKYELTDNKNIYIELTAALK